MKTPNEFWLNLHRLSEAYDAEGMTTEERADNILQQFRQMPPIARRQVFNDLVRLTMNLPDLYPLVAAATNEVEAAPPKQSNIA